MARAKKQKNREDKVELYGEMILPVIPLRNLVITPYMVAPIEVGRSSSVEALEYATENDNLVYLVCQKDFEVEHPTRKDLYEIGCVGRIVQVLNSPEENIKILVEGLERYTIKKVKKVKDVMMAEVERLDYEPFTRTKELQGLERTLLSLFEVHCEKNPRLTDEICMIFKSIEDPLKLIQMIIGQLLIKPQEKIDLLKTDDLEKLFLKVCRILSRENELSEIEQKIHSEVRKQIDEQQKSYFLNEQIKVIEKELGKKEGGVNGEYKKRIAKAKMPEAVAKVAHAELEKLERLTQYSPEGAVVRNYLDWLCDLPWATFTEDNLNLEHAKEILDSTHYGLEKAKRRILEYLAVRKLRMQNEVENPGSQKDSDRSSVLCLVGPPGVGKTSIASAVAESLGRKFIRISLGGVRDEAEIRGHRRTYIGALPGRIVQALKKAGSKNPVILLDEIDKVSSDFRGDPSSALLEVLDPEQNSAFNDHFLEVDLDLSDVMFICTANVDDAIHVTLRDRMERIYLSSYTETEKVKIAQKHLISKQARIAGITKKVNITESCLRKVVRNYTSESGVRQLDRSLAKIMRKIAVKMVTSDKKLGRLSISERNMKDYLGTELHIPDLELPNKVPGVVVGLAWTEVGGEILKIEVATYPGKGELLRTGQLGDVMLESAQAALTYIRKMQKKLGLDSEYFSKTDFHIHVPEGAIPKDGPSAGITMASALYSAVTGHVVKNKFAMTGEITLNGNVLAVGGLKEKILAAHRAGITEVIVPKRSAQEIDDVPKEALDAIKINYVTTMDEVIKIAFEK